MIIRLVGKQSFTSKAGKPCNILHIIKRVENVEGSACDRIFVSSDLFSKVSVNSNYECVYGAYDNGRAFVADLIPTE